MNRQKGYRNAVPPRDVTGEAFELDDAAVPTPAIAGAVAPADSAGIPFPAVDGMEFPAVAEDLYSADDAGGLPPAVCVSELLRPAAGVGPLSDVEAMPSVELWGPVGPSGSHASRGDSEDGSPSDIVIESEPMVCPGVGGLAGLPSAGRPDRSTGEPSDRDEDTPPELFTRKTRTATGQWRGDCFVGVVGSAALWFLTGWARAVEFMIDTGCQVTILATSVFEKMCASDPRVRSRLHPCGRRLVSADI